jgi:O-methyltransferase
LKQALKRLRDRVIEKLRSFLRIPPNYIGDNGCLRAAASFVAWNQVEGDYLEFGVWRGYSFVAAYHEILRQRAAHRRFGFESPEYARWQAARPRFFAFDSFDGLPAGRAERMVDYGPGAYACTEEEFLANLRDQDVDLTDVVTVKGFYEDTCTSDTAARNNLTKAAIVMIDCDLYESTVPVLNFLTGLVQQGTILVFDDWFRFKGSPDAGEQRACREWLARNPHIQLAEFWRQGPQAVAFVVNLKPTVAGSP